MANQNNINQDSMLKTGTVLRGTYRIDGHLSSGGFGNTYVATHILFGSKLAIKEFFMKGVNQRLDNTCGVRVSNSENVDEFNHQLEKFKKEACRLHDLDNKNIVKVHDLFEENGTAYYVMDYIDGEDLRNLLERIQRPMNEDEVMKILPQVLNALHEVHTKKMWHLDLKPANIMVDKSGTVKLIDFGASKQFDYSHGGVTSSAVAYTNGFAPIEQMERNQKNFGPWTDFYALGATLYNLLSNNKPPLPSDINDDRTDDKHLSLPMSSSVSDKLKDLLLWLMTPNRLDRPQSVAEINKQLGLSSVLNDSDVTIVVPGDEGQTPPLPPSPPRPQIKPILLALVAGMLLGILCYSLYDYTTKNPSMITSAVAQEQVDTVEAVTDKLIDISLGKCHYTGDVSKITGKPNGKGIAVFSNGDMCEATFVNGEIGDSIIYYFSDGDKYEGAFRNNAFYKGRYTRGTDGSYFIGFHEDNLPDIEKGQWYDKNGKIINKPE